MFRCTKRVAVLFGMIVAAWAFPAAAQDRTGRTAEQIAREIREAAEAIGTVRDAVTDSVSGIRWRGPERFAVDRCAERVERYGRMRVDDVRRHGRRSWRVYGTVGGGYGRDYGYRGSYSDRSFTCTVRDDGRVKLKTKRIRY